VLAVVTIGALTSPLSAQVDPPGGLRFTAGFGVGWVREHSCPDCGVAHYAGAPRVTLGGGFQSGLLITGVEGWATFSEQRHFLAAFVTAAISPTRTSPIYLRLGVGPSAEPQDCVTVAEAGWFATECGSRGALAI
jgi:hypothetical protein